MKRDPETFAIIGAAMDFVCFESVVVEIKAMTALTSADEAQLINELKATGMGRGLLLNFGATNLEHRPLVFGSSGNPRKSAKSVDEIYL